ncbi:dopamine receptor 1-like protein [Dinothrombium tinctorium]|uniref:Dopamine receptor 1-like protein n=1 Tax=Dinothrombium tinctorium TaxID=1965070 RepID=A0A3S3NL92_9ACAR|nr:dopamine receptor 1-like protein [Dinothrombium tinctorium]RWS04942.1 dopamine receptor 1-like protein [Dinothrombium tinctorium]RWS08917.1 dopamine receptor 1-like protein [Dinothrombium tinctorium]
MTNLAIGALLIAIIIISIVGNLLVCLAIYTDRRLRKLGNLFLASLAVADLFVACFVMTLSLINDMMGYWMFGKTFCDLWIASDVMCTTASILNLCAISLDRFIHIKDPLRYTQRMTKKVVILSVALIWFTSFIISFLPISLGWHKPDKGSVAKMANIDDDNVDDNNVNVTVTKKFLCYLDFTPTYAVFSSSISFYFPCIIMVALYTRLYLYAKKHVNNIRSMAVPLQTQSQNASDHHSNHHVADHKAAVTVGIIMGVFLFCWVPFFCMNIIAGFCKTCIPKPVFITLSYLGWFNSGMNPVIYSIFNIEFREAFRRILFTYLKDRCCDQNRRTEQHRSNSHSVSDPLCNRNGNFIANQKSVTAQTPSPRGLFTYKTRTKTSSTGYIEVIPARSTVDIVCHDSDGKISSI